MRGEHDIFVLSSNTCKSCGAGKHNDYVHSDDCIINLPGKNPEERLGLVKYWNQGWNACIAAGDDDFPIPKDLKGEKLLAWGKGMACAGRMRETLSYEPALRSAA